MIVTLINLTAWGLLLGLPIFGLRRGSSKMLCVGIALLLCRLLVQAISPSLASSTQLMPGAGADANIGAWQLVLLIPLIVGAFPLGLFLHRFVVYNIDPFEEVIGFMIGIFIAVLVVQTFLSAVHMSTTHSEMQASVSRMFLVRQCVMLEGWHGIQHWFHNLNHDTELGQ